MPLSVHVKRARRTVRRRARFPLLALVLNCEEKVLGASRVRANAKLGSPPSVPLKKSSHSITTKTRRRRAHPLQWREHPGKGIRTGAIAGGAVVLTAIRDRRPKRCQRMHASHNTRSANRAPSTPNKALETLVAGAAAVARPPPADARWRDHAPRKGQKNAVRNSSSVSKMRAIKTQHASERRQGVTWIHERRALRCADAAADATGERREGANTS